MAAEALRDALVARGAEVVLLDALEYGAFRPSDSVTTGAFGGPAGPLYDAYWDMRALMPSERRVAPLLRPLYRRLARELADRSPDVLVCTHALPALLAASMRVGGRFAAPIVAVLTDLMPHTMWPLSGVDAYCVASAGARREFAARGVREASIAVTGIPLRPAFDPPPGRDAAREAVGVGERERLVLVVAGARMRGPYARLARMLPGVLAGLAESGATRTVVVTGTDAVLRDHLTSLGLPRTEMLGYVDDMPAWMAAADLLLGKPGGLLSAEGVACGLPMAFLGPAYGQERANASLLSEAGAAVWLRDGATCAAALTSLVAEPERLQRMRRACSSLARPDAARAIAERALALVGAAPYSNASSTSHSMP